VEETVFDAVSTCKAFTHHDRYAYRLVSNTGNQERSRVIFGGLSMPSGQLLNDVWIFKGLSNLQSSTQVHEMQGGSCDIQYTKGDVPPGRKGHQS
jgi:hypothetical protein